MVSSNTQYNSISRSISGHPAPFGVNNVREAYLLTHAHTHIHTYTQTGKLDEKKEKKPLNVI